MKTVFIINPNIDKKKQYRLMEEIKKNYQGQQITIEKTRKEGYAQHIAQKYALHPEEDVHLFICGGDGTIHEVINGIAGCKHIYVSILPLGRGNDFVKSLGDYTFEDFIDLSNYKEPIEIKSDVLKVDGEYAINTISFGFDVQVAKYVNRFRSVLPGKWNSALLYRCIGDIDFNRTKEDFRIQLDRTRLPLTELEFLVFCNGRYYGGGYQPCPEAQLDDGQIDVCLIKPVSRRKLLTLVGEYERGEHIKHTDLVSSYQAKTVHLDTDNEEIYGNLDGEVRAMRNPTIEIVPGAIQLLLPQQKGEPVNGR